MRKAFLPLILPLGDHGVKSECLGSNPQYSTRTGTASRPSDARNETTRQSGSLLLLLFVCLTATREVKAAPGDTLAWINLPTGAGEFGLSIASDMNGNLYYTNYQATNPQANILRKMDKFGTLLYSVGMHTSTNAPITLGEMVWDPVNGVLLAGSDDATSPQGLFSINPTTGLVSNVFTASGYLVDGLARDTDGSIWFHPDGPSVIYHYSLGGVLLGTVTPKDSSGVPLSSVSGVETGSGNHLIVSNVNPPKLFFVDKTTGAWAEEQTYSPPPVYGPEGITCDTINFAPLPAVWIRSYGTALAIEVPSSWCAPASPVTADCPSCAIRTCGESVSGLGSWISFPASPYYKLGSSYVPISRAEDLCNALNSVVPNSVTSVVQHFNSNSSVYSWDCTGMAGCTDGAGNNVSPEPGGCGSACFCIDPGEGYQVSTPGLSVSLQLYTADSTPITITVPGGYTSPDFGVLVSIPCQSGINTAEQFCQLSGLAFGDTVTRHDSCTGTFVNHQCGQITNNYSVLPGEALRIRKFSAGNVTYTNPAPLPGTVPSMINPVTHTYCIAGTSNAVGWSWWIDLGADGVPVIQSPEPFNMSVPGIPSGQGSASFVSAFLNSISGVCPGLTTSSGSNCFTITAPGPGFDFYVGAYGSLANCKVASSGCSFNPLIYLGGSESAGSGSVGECRGRRCTR